MQIKTKRQSFNKFKSKTGNWKEILWNWKPKQDYKQQDKMITKYSVGEGPMLRRSYMVTWADEAECKFLPAKWTIHFQEVMYHYYIE